MMATPEPNWARPTPPLPSIRAGARVRGSYFRGSPDQFFAGCGRWRSRPGWQLLGDSRSSGAGK
jgi:hypothetical protein